MTYIYSVLLHSMILIACIIILAIHHLFHLYSHIHLHMSHTKLHHKVRYGSCS